MDRVRAAGVEVPVIPGIMPLTGFRQLERMVELSGAHVPSSLRSALDKCKTDEDVASAGVDFASKQCSELMDFGVPGFHFYPLNKAAAVSKVIEYSGIAAR